MFDKIEMVQIRLHGWVRKLAAEKKRKQKDALFDGKTCIEVLEEMLLRIMPRQEAAKRARLLLEKFGSLAGVLEAPAGEIARMGEDYQEASAYLRMLRGVCWFYLEDKTQGMKRVFDTQSACAVLRPKFIGRKREAVVLMLLDGRGRVMFNDVVNEGSVSEVPIYIRRVVELCLMYDAYDAILAHNHPSGNPAPSRNDLNATRDVEFALNGIDVTLTDHIIFAGTDYTSLKSSEWLEHIKKEVLDYRRALKKETMEEEAALFAGADD